MSVTSRPCAAAPAAKARERSGEDSRMSCPMTIDLAPSGIATTCANADPIADATASFSCCGTKPRTSYALMNSDSLGALTRQSLSIAQNAQVTAAAGFDCALHLSLTSSSYRGDSAGTQTGRGGLAHSIGQRQQVVRCGAGVHVLRQEPDDIPAPRHGQTLGVNHTQVIGVRLGVGSQRPKDGRLIGVDVGQCCHGTTRAGSSGTLTRQTHAWTLF